MKKRVRLKVNIYKFKKGQEFVCDRVDRKLAFFTVKGEKYCLFMNEDCELVTEDQTMKCKKHPKYKALRKPRTDCETCHKMYEARHKGK